jgi:hypothetical protein
MSYARDNLRKLKRHLKDEAALADGSITEDTLKERNRIKRDIRNGVLPRYHFAKEIFKLEDGSEIELQERTKDKVRTQTHYGFKNMRRLTWRLKSTLVALLDKTK